MENPRGFKRALLLGAAMLAATATAAAAHETITYSYDSRGRLVKVVRTGTVNNGVSVSTDYAYDKADNRTKKETKAPAQ
jgi:YD repeat-containing protein